MSVIKAPQPLNPSIEQFVVFLAGSTSSAMKLNWHELIETAFKDSNKICLLNPKRPDWDSSWKENINDKNFHDQISWELNGLEKANLIVLYFSPDSQSPISLLEFGLFAKRGKLLVFCPEGYWKKGNVDVVCQHYNIKQVNSFESIINYIKQQLNEN